MNKFCKGGKSRHFLKCDNCTLHKNKLKCTLIFSARSGS